MTTKSPETQEQDTYNLFEIGEDGEPDTSAPTELGEKYSQLVQKIGQHDQFAEDQTWQDKLRQSIGLYSPDWMKQFKANQISPAWRYTIRYVEASDTDALTHDEFLNLIRTARSEFLQREGEQTFVFDHKIAGAKDWLYDDEDQSPVIWGDAESNRIAWTRNRPTLLFGPGGSFKTTITHNLLCALAGIDGYETVLGLPVEPLEPGKKVLYLPLDGPKNAKDSLHRFIANMSPGERTKFFATVSIVKELPADLGASADKFVAYVTQALGGDVGVVIIEHVRNIWGDLAQTGNATVAGDALTRLNANHDVSVLALNHSKELGGRKYVRGPEDTYGGSNFRNPMDSVLSVETRGQGDIVAMKQWKAPKGNLMETVKARADFPTGRLTVDGAGLEDALGDGEWYGIAELTEAEHGRDTPKFRTKTYRTIDKLVEAGRLESDGAKRGQQWRLTNA